MISLRHTILCALILAVAALPCARAQSADKPNPATPALQTPPADAQLDLFLLVGQSNMAGRGTLEPQDKEPPARVWTLTKENQWAPAIDPLHFDKSYAGVGPGRTFGIVIAKAQPTARIGLIPCAVGGSSIGRWQKDAEFYKAAIARTREAMKHGKIKAILWHQGEANLPDAVSENTQYWATLRKVFDNIRADLNAPDIPVIIGELGYFPERKNNKAIIAPFNEKLRAFAANYKNCACASADGLTSLKDNLHYDAASARELGRRYADAYLKLSAVKK